MAQPIARVLILITAVTLAAPALAQTNEEKARVQFEQGVALFDDGKYEQAAIAFERAYELNPSFKILWNVGQVENELGHYAKALDAYKRYLDEGEGRIPVSRAAKAKKEIERLSALVGAIRVDSEVDGATVFVGGRKHGITPLSGPVFVDLGEHEVLIRVGGKPVHRELVRVAGGDETVVEVESGATADALAHGLEGYDEEGEEQDGTGGGRVWTWVALGVGGAAAVTGGILGGVVLKKSGDLDGDCPDKQCPQDQWDELDSAKRMATASNVLLGVGAAAIAAGVVLFFVEPGIGGEEEAVALVPTVTADGAGVALGGRF